MKTLLRSLLCLASLLGAARPCGAETEPAAMGLPPRAVADLEWFNTLAFKKPEISRAQLLEGFERIARDYPASRYAERARKTADLLRAMVAEDTAHPVKSDADLASLPPEEHAAELVFRLRDQLGIQGDGPGGQQTLPVDQDAVRGLREPSPAAQLLALGDVAVPPLIAALDDKRLSRVVYTGLDVSSHEVLTVGECARQVLCSIAGRTFDGNSFRTQVEAWWRERHVKGERQQLAEIISQGDDLPKKLKEQLHLYDLAERLRSRYPDAALAAIQQGVSRTRGNEDVNTLVQVASELPGHGPEAFLEMELRQGYSLGIRVTAATGLKRHGRGAEATAAMIREWTAKSAELRLPYEEQEAFGSDDEYGLICFLAKCGRVDAVAALGRDLRRQPLQRRRHVIGLMIPPPPRMTTTRPVNEPDPSLNLRDTDDAVRVQAAVEMLLATELEDTEPTHGENVSARDGREDEDTRMCDLAGNVLSERFKGKYTFDIHGGSQARERQRITCLNVWRAEHGQEPLPVPSAGK